MTYAGNLDFTQLSAQAGEPAAVILRAIREGQAAYDEWQSFRDNRTDVDIATALGVPESQVAELDAAFSAFDSIRRYLENDTPPASIDHGFAMRRFS